MNTISNITLYDLMAEELDIYLTRNENGIDMQIDELYGKNIVSEEGIHRCALDSFADFCRQYLSSYERVTKEL